MNLTVQLSVATDFSFLFEMNKTLKRAIMVGKCFTPLLWSLTLRSIVLLCRALFRFAERGFTLQSVVLLCRAWFHSAEHYFALQSIIFTMRVTHRFCFCGSLRRCGSATKTAPIKCSSWTSSTSGTLESRCVIPSSYLPTYPLANHSPSMGVSKTTRSIKYSVVSATRSNQHSIINDTV